MYRRAAAVVCSVAARCLEQSPLLLSSGLATSTGSLSPFLPGALARNIPQFHAMWRSFSTVDIVKEIDIVNELFAEAREEIEFAKEEAETVYFNESVKTARKAVDACLARWEALLGSLPEEERGRTMRSMGLKIAQLQAEYDEVSKLHLED